MTLRCWSMVMARALLLAFGLAASAAESGQSSKLADKEGRSASAPVAREVVMARSQRAGARGECSRTFVRRRDPVPRINKQEVP